MIFHSITSNPIESCEISTGRKHVCHYHWLFCGQTFSIRCTRTPSRRMQCQGRQGSGDAIVGLIWDDGSQVFRLLTDCLINARPWMRSLSWFLPQVAIKHLNKKGYKTGEYAGNKSSEIHLNHVWGFCCCKVVPIVFFRWGGIIPGCEGYRKPSFYCTKHSLFQTHTHTPIILLVAVTIR